MRHEEQGLNPCFSGCWSRTGTSTDRTQREEGVLILVLVDVGLGPPLHVSATRQSGARS